MGGKLSSFILPLASTCTGFDLSFPPAFKAESHAVERGGSPPVSNLAQQLIPRHRTLGGAQPGGCGHPSGRDVHVMTTSSHVSGELKLERSPALLGVTDALGLRGDGASSLVVSNKLKIRASTPTRFLH